MGLLNSKGMEYFYPIFKDIENLRNPHYKDKFPTLPFPDKPIHGKEYRRRLEKVPIATTVILNLIDII